MISHFSVKNYKCLADVSLPLTPIHVLIGQNDTGKTSLFEAIQAGAKLVATPALADNPVALFAPTPPQELVWHGGANDAAFEFALTLTAPSQSIPTVSSHLVLLKKPRPVREASRKARSLLNGATPSNSNSLNVQLVRFRPTVLARPSASSLLPTYQLASDGFGLSTLLDEITGYDVGRFVELQATFRRFFPKYSRVMLSPTKAWARQQHQGDQELYQPALGKEIRLSSSQGDIRLAQASDGAILLLGFLALTYSPKPPDLILIEEPENGIHPKRLIEVAKLLRQFVQREENAPQIIMTTHSPYLLSEFQPEEVTLMRRKSDDSTEASPLRDAEHIKERMGNEFYLGELWYNLDEEDLLK